jgi:lipid II:glycine glycyltransferase (peptidoglycan interpeptide bridge formation enzyme)
MLNWQEWDEEPQLWDALVTQHEQYSVYQSYAWGVHKSNLGWQVKRFIHKASDGEVDALSQILVKYFRFGVAVVWVPGGFLGNPECYGYQFQQFLKKILKQNLLYVRVNSLLLSNLSESGLFKTLGWYRCKKSLTTGLSLIYDPSDLEDIRATRASGNWRHNWKRSQKKTGHTYFWPDANPEEMIGAYRVMEKNKNLPTQMSHREIQSIFKVFGDNCVLVRCDDGCGNLLAFRGALIMGHKAWDFFAVATPDGRKVYASHAAFMELMNICREKGVTWYDMSGIDPVNNKGVYDFKKGTGAKEIKYLGEWDSSNSRLFRVIAAKLIARKIK